MNDDELDEVLRSLTLPERPQELTTPRPLPTPELVAFAALSLAFLAWAFGTLAQIFAGQV